MKKGGNSGSSGYQFKRSTLWHKSVELLVYLKCIPLSWNLHVSFKAAEYWEHEDKKDQGQILQWLKLSMLPEDPEGISMRHQRSVKSTFKKAPCHAKIIKIVVQHFSTDNEIQIDDDDAAAGGGGGGGGGGDEAPTPTWQNMMNVNVNKTRTWKYPSPCLDQKIEALCVFLVGPAMKLQHLRLSQSLEGTNWTCSWTWVPWTWGLRWSSGAQFEWFSYSLLDWDVHDVQTLELYMATCQQVISWWKRVGSLKAWNRLKQHQNPTLAQASASSWLHSKCIRVMVCNTSKYGKACASARIWLLGRASRLNSAFLLTFSRKIFSCRCTTAAASERCVNAAVCIFTAKCSGAVGTWPSSSSRPICPAVSGRMSMSWFCAVACRSEDHSISPMHQPRFWYGVGLWTRSLIRTNLTTLLDASKTVIISSSSSASAHLSAGVRDSILKVTDISWEYITCMFSMALRKLACWASLSRRYWNNDT